MRPAQHRRKQTPSGGMQNSNVSHRTCIVKTRLSTLFARSRTTSWKFWPALTLPFHRTFGTYFCHRLNSPSIFSVRPCSIQGVSVWEFFQGPFNFNKTPLGLVGCCILIHAKPATRQSWDFRVKSGFYNGPALDSYCCFKLVKTNTKSHVISDTVKFCHLFLCVPVPSAEDKIIHGLQVVVCAIWGAPPPTGVSQLEAITLLQEIFESWRAFAPPSLRPTHRPAPVSPRVYTCISPRVDATSPPNPGPTWLPSTAVRLPLQAAMISLSPVPSATTFHISPRSLVFGDAHSPKVVSKPQQPLLPPSAPVLPVRKPIAHPTRSRAPAPLALFASGGRFHECV
jgi:hypothetical protein